MTVGNDPATEDDSDQQDGNGIRGDSMRSTTHLALAGGLILTGALAFGSSVSFSVAPTVLKVGDGVKITFTVSTTTDVEVAVLAADNTVVRHLAAGVLGGPKPPPPPLKSGLTQELFWDGKDDHGVEVSGFGVQANPLPPSTVHPPPYSIRVRAGLTPQFDGFVGASPYALANVRGLAVDRQGSLFVLEQAYDGHFPGPYDIRVFDRAGAYERTIMPFQATMKKQDAAAFEAVDTGADSPVPRNQYSVWPCLQPLDALRGLKLSATLTADGNLILHEEAFSQIAFLRTNDGATPDGKFYHPLWPASAKLPWWNRGGSPVLAVSPDGKTLYATAFGTTAPKDAKVNPDWPENRVYRFAMDKLGEGGAKFADLDIPDKRAPLDGGWQPTSANSALRSVTVDAKGSVYVCNAAMGKVHRLDASGKETGAIDAPSAHQAAIDPKTGVLYVLTCPTPGRDGEKKLLKFANGDTDAAKVAELSLGTAAVSPFLAADFSGNQPILWIFGGSPAPGVLRIEDDGTALRVVERLNARANPADAILAVDKLAVDPVSDDLYINDGWNNTVRFDGMTARANGPEKGGVPQTMSVTDTAISPDGFVFMQQGPGYSGPFQRLSRDLKPAVPAGATNAFIGDVYGRYGAGYSEKGHCIGWDGKLYSLGMYDWAQYFVCAYDAAGKAVAGKRLVGQIKAGEPVRAGVQSAIIGPVPNRCGGLKVDREGFLYVGIQELPAGYAKPAGFEKDEGYAQMVGSIVKFKPDGGGLGKGDGLKLAANTYEGAVEAYPGLAPFSGWRRNDCCVCRTPRFDLDAYGRLYIPNAVTCSARIVDNSGNEIASFGQYGNFDSQWAPAGSEDRKPLVGTPAIPLGWPLGIGASDKRIYVADMLNRRVVRVKPVFQAEQVCLIK